MPVSLQLLPRELQVSGRVTLSPKAPAPEHMKISVFIFSFLAQQQKLEYWTLLRLNSGEWAFEKENASLLRSSVYWDAAEHNIINLLTEDCLAHSEHVGKYSLLNKHWQNWNILCKHKPELKGWDKPIWCSAQQSLCSILFLSSTPPCRARLISAPSC